MAFVWLLLKEQQGAGMALTCLLLKEQGAEVDGAGVGDDDVCTDFDAVACKTKKGICRLEGEVCKYMQLLLLRGLNPFL